MPTALTRFGIGLLCLTAWATQSWAQEAQEGARPANGGDLVGYGSIHHPTIGRGGMVVAQSRLAAQIGTEILRKGGNAVDAAVAVGFAETMTLPRAGNIGGGGYMLFHDAKRSMTTAIEYYGQAPDATPPDLLIGANGKPSMAMSMTFKGVAVPGTVAGLYEAHRRFGRMKWADLIAPAIELANKGVILSDDEAQALADRREQLSKDTGAKAIYLQNDGTSFTPGARLRNPDLAQTLKLIQKSGAAGFYNGPVAEKIAAAMKANGGVMTTKDLADYRAHVLDPIWSDYRGYKIAYMPPTSAAVTVAEVVNILERFPLGDYPWGGVQSMHLISEALKIGSVDRRFAGGGPQWQTPAHGLSSKEFAAERAKLISMDHALDAKSLPPLDPGPYESAQTTQFTIVDGDGNVVSNTYTLSASFGAHVVAPGTGFLLNNSMSTFDWGGRNGKANAPEPGKRAQSTISPIIIFHDGKPWVATGTPGGGTIMSTMVHVIVNLIDYKLNIAEAIQRPRFSQGGPDEPMLLEESIPDDLIAGLSAKGHKVGRSQIIGSTQSIMIGPDGLLYGAADTRRPDAAAIGVTRY